MLKAKKLAIITTHPIQYYAPVFKLLAQTVNLKVFYTRGKINSIYDPGFEKNINWDIPLLEGYDYEFVENTAKKPSSQHRNGIINPGLVKSLEHYKPHVILVYGHAYQSHLKVMRYFKGKIPVWFRGDSTLLDPTSPLKNLIKTRYLKWVYRHVDLAFYVGLNNKKYFKRYGLKDNQLVFAPHAVDNERFAFSQPEQIARFRAQLGIPEREILILFAGKFEAKKNPLLLLQAFKELNPANAHLLFVGNGPLETELKSKTVQFKLTNQQINKSTNQPNIHFLPFQNQSQMPLIYQAADLFCLPSSGPGETWGLAVNEAMACGKAILISDKVGCASNLVKPGQNGLIFPSGSLPHLLKSLKYLTKSKSRLTEYGQKSRELIQNWSFSAQVSQIKKQLNDEPQRQN